MRKFVGKTKKILHLKGSRTPEPVPSIPSSSSTPCIEDPTPSGMEQSEQAIQKATAAATMGIKSFSGHEETALSAGRDAQAGLSTADDFQDTYLRPLRIFDSVIGEIADVHPYAKMALGVLSCASKIILAQADRDKAVLALLKKLIEVYAFMTEDKDFRFLLKPAVLGRISQQTLECAHFITDYSETKNFWKRLGKNILSETNQKIQEYNNALDTLMQNFRDEAIRDVKIIVHSIDDDVNLNRMTYAAGAGLDTGKQCLEGTRVDILSDIMGWINSSGEDVPRMLWLSGPAGTGKSAISHTIASSFIGVGGFGSCYCFDQAKVAENRHEKVFSTIARDLADRHPEMRRALAETVQNDTALKTTTDVFQQWQKFLIEPLGKLSVPTVGPVVIVIEALDESGTDETRRKILSILAGTHRDPAITKITALPQNFRIIVTSRPLPDIKKAFANAQHILRMSMDNIPPAVAERDIYAYISQQLEALPHFGDKEYTVLAKTADGLFEWARLACAFINTPPTGSDENDAFNAVVSSDLSARENLLYEIYGVMLRGIMQTDKRNVEFRLARFRSVMGQLLGAAEPLSLASLNAMRSHFPDKGEHYEVKVILGSMGSLLSGTTDSSIPIRPLHASFRDFLTEQSDSKEFFVDVSKVQRDLAFASLRVMKDGLRFNICDLKSSYLPNSKDPGLQKRVETSIPPHLSYSSRFWITHIRTTDFDEELAEEIKVFFGHERLFFWLELLALINALSGAAAALPLIAKWAKGHSAFKYISSTALDVQRFIQVFGGIISYSTPHLYVSALPFSPTKFALSGIFSEQFPNTLRVASGRDINWPAAQTVLIHPRSVSSVSFSPDGTRIVTGSHDCTVRLWDAATGQPVGEPLLGHTGSVNSVSFSPDGTRIVTGSHDETVRLWDAATGRPVCEPLLGHTDSVNSVSFSPDGTRIVTGSDDGTVRLWDAATGQPVGEPLRGHVHGVSSVSFSPDGTRIVTSSHDDTVRLWDAATRQPLQQSADTWNNHAIRFSSNSTHALCNTAELTKEASHDDRSPTPFLLHDSGWMLGPNHRLLFWVPLASRHRFLYNPETALVIPGGGPELDLSRMAHGQHWRKCYWQKETQ